MLAVGHETELITARRDALQGSVDTLSAFDKKVAAAQARVNAAQAEAAEFGKLLDSRTTAVRRLNAVRESLVPGMWIEKWGTDRVVIRYWKDRIKAEAGKTVGERVVEKLKGKAVVAVGADGKKSVKIADMSSIGKDAQVEQITIEVKFK